MVLHIAEMPLNLIVEEVRFKNLFHRLLLVGLTHNDRVEITLALHIYNLTYHVYNTIDDVTLCELSYPAEQIVSNVLESSTTARQLYLIHISSIICFAFLRLFVY